LAIAGVLAASHAAEADSVRSRSPVCVDSSFKWKNVEVGYETLDESLDLDGDKRPDRLVGSASWGSSVEERVVRVELSRDHSTIEVETTAPFNAMVGRDPVPARLLQLPDVRRAVELVLFDRVCDVADPSLARVLSSAPTWSSGRPTLVDNYMVLVGNEWVSYGALNHKRTAKLGVTGGFTKAARRGSLVLMTTAHGVVLVDEARKRYSWVFVVEEAERKLRFRSVTKAKFQGDHAVVTVDGKAIDVLLPAP
jgi:hypothetical protein